MPNVSRPPTTDTKRNLTKRIFFASTVALFVVWILASFIIPREELELAGLYYGVIFLALYAPLLLVSLVSGMLLLVELIARLLVKVKGDNKLSQKIIATRWIWVILGVTLVLGLWFSFTTINRFKALQPAPSEVVAPSPDLTKNWKTYTNKNYGYKIKYPNDWIVNKIGTDLNNNQTTWFSPNSTINSKIGKRQLEIVIGGKFVYSTSGAICTNQWCEEYGSFILNTAKSSISATRIKASVGQKKEFDFYTFQVNPRIYLYETPVITATYFTEEEEKLISKILSTIKFPEDYFFISASRINEIQNLYVVVNNESPLIPTMVEVIDTETNLSTGPYNLVVVSENYESFVCPNLFTYGKVYWTNDSIKEIKIPLVSENIAPNTAGNPLMYRLTLKDSTGIKTTLDIKDWGYYCESSAS